MNKGLKDKIKVLYFQGLTYRKIAEALQCSKGTISYHLGDFKEQERNDRTKWLESLELQQFENRVEFLNKYENLLSKAEIKRLVRKLFHRKSSRFKSNTAEYYRARRREIKESLINYKGGECIKCSYNRCYKALQFHHLDPSKKDFNISTNIRSLRFEKIKEEIDKCILVCANCHAEIHEEIIRKQHLDELLK